MTQSARPLLPVLDPKTARDALERVANSLSRTVLGKEQQVKLAVTSLIAGGHLLLEDVPGVGKTTLAEAMARVFGLSFARIQFTADLLPADVTGVQIFQAKEG